MQKVPFPSIYPCKTQLSERNGRLHQLKFKSNSKINTHFFVKHPGNEVLFGLMSLLLRDRSGWSYDYVTFVRNYFVCLFVCLFIYCLLTVVILLANKVAYN